MMRKIIRLGYPIHNKHGMNTVRGFFSSAVFMRERTFEEEEYLYEWSLRCDAVSKHMLNH